MEFKGYGLPKWSDNINHLSYADDTILFCSGKLYSIKSMMKVLRGYEKLSGQMVNLEKSLFYLHKEVPTFVAAQIRRMTGIRQGNFPFTYLGCPIFYGRKRKSHFEELTKKVMRRLATWQNKLLSFGGRFILINNVLQSILVYLLSAMNLSIKVINQLHKIIAKFYWGNTAGAKNKHWVSWEGMCYPKEKGGLGFRSLHHMSKAVFAKLWWVFRTSTSSLWSTFIWNKYCIKKYPLLA